MSTNHDEVHCPGFLWNEDEKDCTECKGGSQLCNYTVKDAISQCIPRYMICDQVPDCIDHSDEQFFHCDSQEECPGACSFENEDQLYTERHKIMNGHESEYSISNKRIEQQQIQCSNGQLINIGYACSGNYPQCDSACPKCTMGGFRCLEEGKCLNSSAICDGVFDCIDGSDELACTNVTGSCDEEFRLCNGFADCINGYDELNCTLCKNDTELILKENPLFKFKHWETISIPKAFHCKKDQKCISLLQRCDGLIDCSDEADEEGCTCHECLTHPYAMYICQKGMRCFRLEKVCQDGVSMCPNATTLDQEYCSNYTKGLIF